MTLQQGKTHAECTLALFIMLKVYITMSSYVCSSTSV